MKSPEPETDLHVLDGSHDREAFDCGVEELNNWLRTSASQQARNNTALTIVATPKYVAAWHEAGYGDVTEGTVLGYFAISSGQAEGVDLRNEKNKKMPRSVPVARLGRLAVDQRFQGQGLGEVLLVEAIMRTLSAAESIGVAGIFVDAKAGARSFYEKFGFLPAEDAPDKLWLPLASIRQLLDKS